MPFHYEYAESYDQLVNEIKEHYDKEEYYDALHEVIDNYVTKYDYEAKEVIDKYGVFKIIEEYENQYGDFEIDKSEMKNYMKLYYILIYNYIMENYMEEFN
jgi:hypothetical protein